MDFKEYSIGEFDTEEQKEFRKEVREWIDKNIGPSLTKPSEERALDREADLHDTKEFGRKLAAKGWLTPEWPKEYGGAGLTADQRYIINQEVAARDIELPGHWGRRTRPHPDAFWNRRTKEGMAAQDRCGGIVCLRLH
jgi:alkylation response protein AidB-like acyl-CoA dehydrogenase